MYSYIINCGYCSKVALIVLRVHYLLIIRGWLLFEAKLLYTRSEATIRVSACIALYIRQELMSAA